MPVDWDRYPANWPRVVAVIRRRSGDRCEWCEAANLQPHPVTGSRVVLTTAHLGEPFAEGADKHDKHDKHDIRAENLAHLCQRCHLAHDRDEHRVNSSHTRAEKKAAGTLEFPHFFGSQ